VQAEGGSKGNPPVLRRFLTIKGEFCSTSLASKLFCVSRLSLEFKSLMMIENVSEFRRLALKNEGCGTVDLDVNQ
jgi:hypothetical protein